MRSPASLCVAIKGGGDIGSGVATRLHRSGFRVLILECPQPTVIRRQVAFAQAVFDGTATVEDLSGCLVDDEDAVGAAWTRHEIPVMVDPRASSLQWLHPDVLVDATLCKKNPRTSQGDAPLVIGLGPGFEAGLHCLAVIETQRGHDLGRVLWSGRAAPDSGSPGSIAGRTTARVLRAPTAGRFSSDLQIGATVLAGDPVAQVADELVYAAIGGVIRGLLQNGLVVVSGMKIGDIDPRGIAEYCFTVSEKALAVGGGVLEAILAFSSRQDPG